MFAITEMAGLTIEARYSVRQTDGESDRGVRSISLFSRCNRGGGGGGEPGGDGGAGDGPVRGSQGETRAVALAARKMTTDGRMAELALASSGRHFFGCFLVAVVPRTGVGAPQRCPSSPAKL